MKTTIKKIIIFWITLIILAHLVISVDKNLINGLTIIEIYTVGALLAKLSLYSEQDIKTISGINMFTNIVKKLKV